MLLSLTPNGTLPRLHVPAACIDQSFPRDLSEPGIERQRLVLQVLGQLAGRLHKGLLHDIRRVEAAQ